ncbi:MAG: VOC family protein [Candidatus Binatia bacterium]
MQVHPYLFFHGRCEEAVEFYTKSLGAHDVELMRFSDSPEPTPPDMLAPGYDNKIMHGQFKVGDLVVMVSDGSRESAQTFAGFALALSVPTEADADRVFNALADGGKVGMPLAKTFWSPRFGMLSDRFGVDWMVMTTP